MLPRTGIGLTLGGVTMTALNLVWLGIAAAVIGGTLITLSKLAPRVAVEPVPVGVRGSRFRVTWNGRPVTRRRKPRHRA
ncbi:hypothetical protein [Symbioplanes lichenis]|uniref:hypothetical protein n=1 Tax=Symbioplanes lichenis TaxID=1629072 RepID=UPI00273A326C|nr:hypothetical protein [Actinoplanes lichenis]